MGELPLTWRQVAAFRLQRHGLLDRSAAGATDPSGALAARTGEIGGVQAQLLSAAQLALWARLDGLQMAHIEQAFAERTLVKAAGMRQTQFFFPANELALFVRGAARRAEKAVRWTLGKGVPQSAVERAAEAALQALDQPRTRPEIARLVCRALGVREKVVQGGVGWGSRREVSAVPVGHIDFPVVYLLQLAAARGVFCSGPNHGSEPTFVRADAWIPGWRDLPQDEAEARLLVRYLRAFGPAAPADYAQWSGMTLGEARSLWAQAGLAAVSVEGWQAQALPADLPALAQAERALGAPAPPVVRLLPHFDTFLLGHVQRGHLAAPVHQPLIYRPQGWIAPVILVDGRAAGTWEQAHDGDSLRIRVKGFAPLSAEVRAGIEAQASRLASFVGAEGVEVEAG